jgi:hypothetical protein
MDFSSSFPGFQEQWLGGEGAAKTILVPSPPPPAAPLKEAAGLAGILRRIMPFHCFRTLFLFFSKLQDTRAGRKKPTHTHRDRHTHPETAANSLELTFFFPFPHSPTSRGIEGNTRTSKQTMSSGWWEE